MAPSSVMRKKHFKLTARISTNSPAKVRGVLNGLFTEGTVKVGASPGEFVVEAEMDGESSKDLNRSLLSALRRVEKKTRLRSEWRSEGATETFFDYVSKGPRSGDS